MHIRAGDTVVVLTGTDRNTRAKVLQVNRQTGKALVEGVARVYKHVRRSQKHPQGGRLSKEMPVQISNVLLLCPKCNKSSRTGVKLNDDGTKARVCRRCGNSLGQISAAKK